MNLQEYKILVERTQLSNEGDVLLALQLLMNAKVDSLLLRRVIWNIKSEQATVSTEFYKDCIDQRTYDIYPAGEIKNFNPTDEEIEDLLIKSDRNEIKVE